MITRKMIRFWLGLLTCFTLVWFASTQAGTPSFFNVLDYGVVADGVTPNTAAIQKPISAAASIGGGTVYFPAGVYLTGAIHLKSNITLFVDAGVVLRFSADFDDYLPMVKSRWEGTVGMNFSPLIYGYQLENIAIVGRGILDGQGKAWWDFYGKIRAEYKKYGEVRTQSKWQKLHLEANQNTVIPDTWMWSQNHFLRPPFIQFFECKNILIRDVKIINSPFWTINPELCDNVTVTGVTSPVLLTTIHQPTDEIGILSVEILLRKIQGETVNSRYILKPSLVVRSSCGAQLKTRGQGVEA